MKTKLPKKYQGLHTYRFKENPDEEKFATVWAEICKLSDDRHLSYLMSLDNDGNEPISDRDRLIANTIIQWLGSPCGQYFLKDCGFTKKSLDK